MSKTSKRRRLYISRPGEGLGRLMMDLFRNRDGTYDCAGVLMETIYGMAREGRIWYLPRVDAYAFRVVCKPAYSFYKEVWLLFDDPYTWTGRVAVRSQAWVEQFEPQRAHLTASQYYEGLLGLFIAHKRSQPEWAGRGMTPLDEIAAGFSYEPFKSAMLHMQCGIVGPEDVHRRLHENVHVGDIKVFFHDGSFLEADMNSMNHSNTTSTEIGDAVQGRTMVITNWEDMGGIA